jgi:predicted Rossmann fold flavoprotein
MMAWLSEYGVETKIEADGRVFPVSDSSQTIIDCFMQKVKSHNIELVMHEGVKSLIQHEGHWSITSSNREFESRTVMLATGSTPSVWEMLEDLGYEIIPPVPSLFTFNIKDKMLEDLQGLSMPEAEVRIPETGYSASGPLLITHWGLSGPAVLKCSAWAARELNAKDYRFQVEVNWISADAESVKETIEAMRREHGKRMAKKYPLFEIPRRLWERFCWHAKLREDNYGSLTAEQIQSLIQVLTCSIFTVNGKSTFKEEFVTCGGVDLKQIDFKHMESRIHPALYMAGEVLNIDAITGGFNFQAAWTEAYIAAEAMAMRLSN